MPNVTQIVDSSGNPVVFNTTTVSQYTSLAFVSNYKLFDFKFLGQDNGLLWYQTTSGGGTGTFSSPNKINMTLTTANGDEVIRQTKRFPGQLGGVIMIWQVDCVLGAIKANVRQRAGAFDSNDGFFFEQNGTTLRVVVRSSVSGAPVDTATAQASWNIDKLDGTGASGITLNTDNFNSYFITFNEDFVQFGVIINGIAYYCHRINGPNNSTTGLVATINQPIRLEITNTGVSASGTTLSLFAAAVNASGGSVPYSINRSVDLGITGKLIPATLTPLISLRLNSASVRRLAAFKNFNILSSNSQSIYYQIVMNGSLTGASFVATPGTNTITEYDITASAITGGNVLYSGYTSLNNGGGVTAPPADLFNMLKISSNIAGTSDIITFAVIKISGTSPTGFMSVLFEEI